jgi:hypothetical protein
MKFRDIVRLDETFSHMSEKPPHTATFFNVTQMNDWAKQTRQQVILFPVEHAHAKAYMLRGGVGLARLQELTVTDLQRPLTFIRWTETSKLMVDGHHRYVLADQLRISRMPGWLIDTEDWKKFVIEDMPDDVRKRGIYNVLAQEHVGNGADPDR